MKKQTLVALWIALGALASGSSAHAVLKRVLIQGDVSPNGGAAYRRFHPPAAGDAAGERLAFYSGTDGGARCLFRVDTAGGAGTVIRCQKTATPDGRLFLKF